MRKTTQFDEWIASKDPTDDTVALRRLRECWNAARWQEAQDAAKEIATLKAALENCRLLAARNRQEAWALLILGFCAESGVVGSVTR